MLKRTTLQKFFAKKNNGFSAIELSVAVAVAGVAAMGYLVWAKPENVNNAEKMAQTREKISRVEKALSDFYSQEGRLPCPAMHSISPDGSRVENDGSRTSAAAATENFDFARETTTISLTGIACNIDIGAPPVITLGLDESYIFDGWGNQFTYHVSDSLCGNDVSASDEDEADGCSSQDFLNNIADLSVNNREGNSITTEAAYVLVSHGADGIGSYLRSGQQKSGTVNENANADTTYQLTYSNQTDTDLVAFKTKSQMGDIALDSLATVISADACNTNSSSLEVMANTDNTALNSNTTGINQFKLQAASKSKNEGSTMVLSLLWNIQSTCIDYFGNIPNSDIDWDGPACPGGGTFNILNDTCECASGTWDGNCSI